MENAIPAARGCPGTEAFALQLLLTGSYFQTSLKYNAEGTSEPPHTKIPLPIVKAAAPLRACAGKSAFLVHVSADGSYSHQSLKKGPLPPTTPSPTYPLLPDTAAVAADRKSTRLNSSHIPL